MKRSKFTEEQIAFALKQAETGIKVSEVCRKIGISEATFYNKSIKDDRVLRQRICEIAAIRIRYGYQRIHILLKREGWHVNHKRVLKIYREEGLNLRSKRPKRRVAAAHRMKRTDVSNIDQCWPMDFVADNLFNGRRIGP